MLWASSVSEAEDIATNKEFEVELTVSITYYSIRSITPNTLNTKYELGLSQMVMKLLEYVTHLPHMVSLPICTPFVWSNNHIVKVTFNLGTEGDAHG